ncbi:hypothetical protein A2U01_0084912, partial [Trifolium medium]|nr:hypothetical protein [Trifolium medium]
VIVILLRDFSLLAQLGDDVRVAQPLIRRLDHELDAPRNQASYSDGLALHDGVSCMEVTHDNLSSDRAALEIRHEPYDPCLSN